ncbi:MAG TPA: hypothetical protein VEJ89_09925 [Myxococcaceae bacterium]|nr:hypothetical protein [Myxococcaceae bacterium]
MAGRRTLPLLFVLWASLAHAQALNPSQVIYLDGGGQFEARAYPVYTSPATPYIMAGAGANLQVFDMSGNEVANQPGTFDNFAVANAIPFGSETATLVATASYELGTCGGTRCLRFFRWDPVGGFQPLNFMATLVLESSAMTIDTSANPMVVYYTGLQSASQPLYSQAISVGADGGVSFLTSNMRTVQTNTVGGLAAYPPSTLFLSADTQPLYSFPSDLTMAGGGVVNNQYNDLHGLFLVLTLPSGGSSLLAGDQTNEQVLFFNPDAGVYQGGLSIDGGNRLVAPSGVAITPDLQTLIVAETYNPQIPAIATNAAIYLVPFQGIPDGGNSVPDGGGGGGGPVIPAVPPGPGQAVPSTYSGCSSAGGGPLLLTFLVPVLLARRRRR